MYCSSCGAQVSPAGKFCASCGKPVDPDTAATLDGNEIGSEGETIAPAAPTPRKPPSSHPSPRTPRITPSSNPLTSSDPIGGGRFTPGQIIAERYRVVALAGRGGMGEVYRAEDLKLSQVVAIKFLPEALSQDAAALARFHAEVRTARQVSHPNVCRVFDIGEADGILFLTMEYVDGEDLASVVRRIGRLSPDKASEVARQICAGLAAAHERGVIHRDLKPANVMLDGAGKIRITDFGLASIAASIKGAEARAGTPAYMAPEQLAGREVTTKSDIYSLGLILYEILTGKRAFEASTLPELMKQRESGVITNPSTLVRDLDPLIERVILRCLEKDPDKRPVSALQVAAALPGGDPLAAALAAGETPSPEMVAAAGETDGLARRTALVLLAVVAVSLFAFVLTANRFKLYGLVPLAEPPEVLQARAREIIKQLGYTAPAVDSAYSFEIQGDFLDYVKSHDKTLGRWEVLTRGRPAGMVFWYRESPREMRAHGFYSSGGSGQITSFDPPMAVSGMILVILDTNGHLLHFEEVPPQRDPPAQNSPPPDWQALFSAADLDATNLHGVASEWTPLVWGDSRAAWTRTLPGRADITERIEAAAYRGKPVYFDVIYPWEKPPRDIPFVPTTHEKLAILILATLFLGLIVASTLVVRRNLKLKRGDTRGALRLGTFVLVTFLIVWLLRAHHVTSPGEFDITFIALSWALLYSGLATIFYLALEPYVRRKDPHTLIAWSRLLAGQWRDPLVGRDLLIGTVYGTVLTLFESADNFLLPLFGKLPPAPGILATESLKGVLPSIGLLLHFTLIFLLYALLIFFLLFLLRLVVRKDWIAAIVIVILGAGTNTGGDYPLVTFIASAVIWLSILLILKRFGLLVLIVGLVVQNVLQVFPVTYRLSQWYAAPGLAGVLAIAALAIYGFYTALAGKPIFSGDALDI
jgi:hypothetical protein